MTQQRLIPKVADVIRRKGYSYTTEKSYINWILRYIRFHKKTHPAELGENGIAEFLTFLAREHQVSASTQNQALNALVFLYKQVLEIDLGKFPQFLKAKKSRTLPVILGREEIASILSNLKGSPYLMLSLVYGCGLRLREVLNLRIKDIDFASKIVFVRQGKGKKDRAIPLPSSISGLLKEHIERVRELHKQDLAAGFGSVQLPFALSKKYPRAPYQFHWQWLFPSRNISKDPRSDFRGRYHLHESVLIRHIQSAAKRVKIDKKITVHSFRHSYATHMVESGSNIKILQELLGHRNVKTTMVYLHLAKDRLKKAGNPLDTLEISRAHLGDISDCRSEELRIAGV